ncbi:hypothetical protein HanPI659440_Chr01g0030811 [Helianthus annuus]|nr:hypothetical protein HanPI659440_Chr01g0030811 [Helianthus annuus]
MYPLLTVNASLTINKWVKIHFALDNKKIIRVHCTFIRHALPRCSFTLYLLKLLFSGDRNIAGEDASLTIFKNLLFYTPRVVGFAPVVGISPRRLL